MSRDEAVRILLVEDEPGDVLLFKEVLRHTTYRDNTLVHADTLTAAIGLQGTPFDVIMLDLKLPESHGLQTVLDLKEHFPETAVVILTHRRDRELSMRALRSGAQAYLIKGEIGPGELESTIRHSIQRQEFILRMHEAERALSVSELRFRALIEHASDLILMTNRQGDIHFASPSVHRLFGMTSLGSSVFAPIAEADREEARAVFSKALDAPGQAVPLLLHTHTPEGDMMMLAGTVVDLSHLEGVGSLVMNMHDVTQREMMLATMAFDRSNLNALINSSPDPVWSLDPDYRLVTANEAFLGGLEQLTGRRFTSGDSLMLPDLEGVPATRMWHANFTRAMRGRTVHVEEYFSQPSESWIDVQYNPIRKEDEIIGVACFSRNITEARKAERAVAAGILSMRASEQEKALILNALPANIALLDKEGTIVAVNAAWHAFALENDHHGEKQSVGMNYIDLIRGGSGMDPQTIARIRDGIGRVLDRIEDSFSMEYAFGSGDRTRWFRMQSNTLSKEGDNGAVVVHADITERKVAEEAVMTLNAELEQRVNERTNELLRINERLELQMSQNEKLAGLLEQRNTEMMSSISYARHIQNSLFPEIAQLGFFKDTALLSHPKNVVSGDFAWHHETDDLLFFALVDCTGHGVPGALMSMLGHSLLTQIVVDHQETRPEMILQAMDVAVGQLFSVHREAAKVNDGMDVALMVVDRRTRILSFAGALLRCLILRNGELRILECTRASIGGHSVDRAKRFERVDMQLQDGDRIVLSTDGFYSQFNGTTGRKMSTSIFRSRLSATGSLDAKAAVAELDRFLVDWMGEEDQVDDILLALLDV